MQGQHEHVDPVEEHEIVSRSAELDRIAADIEEAYTSDGTLPTRPLTADMVGASLCNLGHTATGEVVFSTVNLTSLSIGSLDILASYRHLQKILLDMNRLTSVAAIGKCESLVHLSLSNNQLTHAVFAELAPTSITLQYLDVSNNHLESLDGVSRLTFLNTLLVADNRLTTIAVQNQVAELRSLWKLSVASNQLTSIDDGAFAHCPLRILDLTKNSLTDVAPLSSLASTLVWLGLDDNNIMHLHQLMPFSNLTTLRLAGNNVYDMSEAHMLASIASLRHLALLGNPLCTFGILPAPPIEDDLGSDKVRPDDTVDTGSSKPAPPPAKLLPSARFAPTLKEEVNAPFVPREPQEMDEARLAALSDEARYRLHVIWRVPQIASLDGVDITSSESAEARNLVGGVSRANRLAAQELLRDTKRPHAVGSGAAAARSSRHPPPQQTVSV